MSAAVSAAQQPCATTGEAQSADGGICTVGCCSSPLRPPAAGLRRSAAARRLGGPRRAGHESAPAIRRSLWPRRRRRRLHHNRPQLDPDSPLRDWQAAAAAAARRRLNRVRAGGAAARRARPGPGHRLGGLECSSSSLSSLGTGAAPRPNPRCSGAAAPRSSARDFDKYWVVWPFELRREA